MEEQELDVLSSEESEEESKRKRLLALLIFLLLILFACGGLFYRYVQNPEPLPDMLLPTDVNYAPHYLFSIYLDMPVGVALSPKEDRLYVAETGGERVVKIFSRDGAEIGQIVPPETTAGERAPVYLATDDQGRVFVTDRLQHAVYLYDRDGKYLDTLIHSDMPLSEYVAQHLGGTVGDLTFSYNNFQESVYYQPVSNQEKLTLPAPNLSDTWAPLGVSIDSQNNLWITDVAAESHRVYQFSIPSGKTLIDWHDLNQTDLSVGSYGQGNGELLYPNKADIDSQGRIYVSDGNNGRIAVWDASGDFLFNFAGGAGEGSLSLPRGLFIDSRDRLFVVDAVGQDIKVYDVSRSEPMFLHKFGEFGIDDGYFNFPNDIVIDKSGRLYIADRENNRVQVWSY